MDANATPALSKTERREYLAGVITALVLVGVLVGTALANRGPQQKDDVAFTLTAAFQRADGLHVGSPVRVAGVNVGMISAATLDENRNAVLTFDFTQALELSDDTAAVIETDGLFGAKYIELRPGGSEDILKSGARMSYVQNAVIIEDLVALIVQRAQDARAVKAAIDEAKK